MAAAEHRRGPVMRRLASGCLAAALVWPMTQAESERALALGRAFDAERAKFHRPYLIPVSDATVERLEIVTEFRRVVLFAEEQIQHGDHMFGVRQSEAALARWHGRVTIVAHLRFHPLNTYISAPSYDVIAGDPPIEQLDLRRTALYAQASNKKGRQTALSGEIVEADFDAQTIGQAVRPIRVVFEGKEVTKTTVDFARLE